MGRDLRGLYELRASRKDYEAAAARNERSPWYGFEAQARRLPALEPCLWSAATGDVGWGAVYDAACRWGNWLRDERGVRPGDFVAFYLTNSVDMALAMIGVWSVGAFPCLVNFNLAGDGAVHCLGVAKPKFVLVDEDEACRARIEDVREKVEGQLGMRIFVLDRALREQIDASPSTRPPDELRDGVQDSDAAVLIFTRYVRILMDEAQHIHYYLRYWLTMFVSQWHHRLPQGLQVPRRSLPPDRRPPRDSIRR